MTSRHHSPRCCDVLEEYKGVSWILWGFNCLGAYMPLTVTPQKEWKRWICSVILIRISHALISSLKREEFENVWWVYLHPSFKASYTVKFVSFLCLLNVLMFAQIFRTISTFAWFFERDDLRLRVRLLSAPCNLCMEWVKISWRPKLPEDKHKLLDKCSVLKVWRIPSRNLLSNFLHSFRLLLAVLIRQRICLLPKQLMMDVWYLFRVWMFIGRIHEKTALRTSLEWFIQKWKISSKLISRLLSSNERIVLVVSRVNGFHSSQCFKNWMNLNWQIK